MNDLSKPGPFELFGRALDQFVVGFSEFAHALSRTWNWTADDHHIEEFVLSLESRGYVYENMAVLIVYDPDKPSNTMIITEAL